MLNLLVYKSVVHALVLLVHTLVLLACDVKKYRAVIGRKYKVPVFLCTPMT